MNGIALAEMYLGSVWYFPFQDACEGVGGDQDSDATVWDSTSHPKRAFFDAAYTDCIF